MPQGNSYPLGDSWASYPVPWASPKEGPRMLENFSTFLSINLVLHFVPHFQPQLNVGIYFNVGVYFECRGIFDCKVYFECRCIF